ncbi:uncharacterized protein LOC111347562, partial [Stylophora pistillata]|uniref:uncharacterized protein LOC111347562 n=1 Tax=Stylophora pistillata TaxID=50429 RepID=UPI000C04CDB2
MAIKNDCNKIFHLKFINVWILALPRLTDGGSVTWYEPTPVITTSHPTEVLPPGIVQVYEGSPVTLNWNYSLTTGFFVAVMPFNVAGIVSISSAGQAGAVSSYFQQGFNASSTLGRGSLFINNVTVADDRANGEFICDIIDFNADTWRRTIRVKVI